MEVRSRPYIARMFSNPNALECVDFARDSAFIVEQGRIFMKMLRLCFLLLLSICLAGVSYAQDAHTNSSKPDSFKMKSSEAKSDFPAAHFADGVTGRLPVNARPGDIDWQNRSNTQDCAYMRTYRVKRQARGSDYMVSAGYTTCVPMGRFETRSAVETITDSGDKK